MYLFFKICMANTTCFHSFSSFALGTEENKLHLFFAPFLWKHEVKSCHVRWICFSFNKPNGPQLSFMTWQDIYCRNIFHYAKQRNWKWKQPGEKVNQNSNFSDTSQDWKYIVIPLTNSITLGSTKRSKIKQTETSILAHNLNWPAKQLVPKTINPIGVEVKPQIGSTDSKGNAKGKLRNQLNSVNDL